MMEISIEHDRPSAIASVFIDSGNGFNENQRVDLPLKQDKLSKRLVFLPYGARRLRLDPFEECGRFSVVECRFVWLTPKFAWSKLYGRLSHMHPLFINQDVDSIRTSLKSLAKKQGLSWKKVALSSYEELFRHNQPEANYARWLLDYGADQLSEAAVHAKLSNLNYQPLISIILPVYNTEPQFLRECIESVKLQSYPNWQLCISDDGSDRADTRSLIEKYGQADERIQLILRSENGHISASSNSALDLVEGEFTALLDHDDKLAQHALLYVVESLNEDREALLIYSDEDKIDENGHRFSPHFKSEWNPDLLYSQNYICHLSVFQTNRLRQVGGFRVGLEGSQDHDLLLRFTEGLKAEQVTHIPRILYHWRAIEGSTALASGEKSYTEQAGLQAVQDFINEKCSGAIATKGLVANSYRVKWPVPESQPLVTILIPTRNGFDILKPCVDAILERTDYKNFELFILDNQSNCKDTLAYMDYVESEDARVKVLRWNYPFNYSAINNFGVKHANGSIIALLNNDVEPINNEWLTEMVSQVSRKEIGCVGAMLYYPNETIQHGGVVLGIGGVAGHSHKYFMRGHNGYFSRLKLVQNYSAVTAACLLVRKSVYEEVGGLNERHLTVAFNDVDFCLKVREMGYRNLWTPYAELYHHESVSRGGEDNTKKRARFKTEVDYMRKTWGNLLDNDPAYNRNLSLSFEDFSLRNSPTVSDLA